MSARATLKPPGDPRGEDARANFAAYLADGPAADRPPFYATSSTSTEETP